MAEPLPEIPANFKSIQHYLKTAAEHEKRDPVVTYYCRLYAMQRGMEIDKKSPDCRNYLRILMNLLEQSKKQLNGVEAIQSEVVGHVHLENYALKLFYFADTEDRAGRFGKNVVKSFYTAGMLMDVLSTFGELVNSLKITFTPVQQDFIFTKSPEQLLLLRRYMLPCRIEKNRKYAKWKAAYIHNCLKNGETPQPGPLAEAMDEFEREMGGSGPSSGPAGPGGSQSAPVDNSTQYPTPAPRQPTAQYPMNQPLNNVLPNVPTNQQGYPPVNQPSYPPVNQPNYQPFNQPNYPPINSFNAAPGAPTPGAPAVAPISYQPEATPRQYPAAPEAGVRLKAEDFTKAMKFCKFASSALQYEDAKTAIENLNKALRLLTTGKE